MKVKLGKAVLFRQSKSRSELETAKMPKQHCRVVGATACEAFLVKSESVLGARTISSSTVHGILQNYRIAHFTVANLGCMLDI